MQRIFLSRSSHQRCSIKKDVLKNFADSQENTCAGFSGFSAFPGPATLFKKRLWHRRFPVNFAKYLRTPILKNICERLSRSTFNFDKTPTFYTKTFEFGRQWVPASLIRSIIILEQITSETTKKSFGDKILSYFAWFFLVFKLFSLKKSSFSVKKAKNFPKIVQKKNQEISY